jgi:hypothetical protein
MAIKMELCDTTSLHGEITVQRCGDKVVITQDNSNQNVVDNLVVQYCDLPRFVNSVALIGCDNEESINFEGAKSEL